MISHEERSIHKNQNTFKMET